MAFHHGDPKAVEGSRGSSELAELIPHGATSGSSLITMDTPWRRSGHTI